MILRIVRENPMKLLNGVVMRLERAISRCHDLIMMATARPECTCLTTKKPELLIVRSRLRVPFSASLHEFTSNALTLSLGRFFVPQSPRQVADMISPDQIAAIALAHPPGC